jgi:hypothetical protein
MVGATKMGGAVQGPLWTIEQEAELRALVLASKDIETIARQLDRSPLAIRRRANKLKITLKKVATRR